MNTSTSNIFTKLDASLTEQTVPRPNANATPAVGNPINKDLYERQVQIKKTLKTLTKFSTEYSKGSDYLLEIVINDEERDDFAPARLHPDATSVASVAAYKHTSVAPYKHTSASYEESVDRFAQFVMHTVKQHAKSSSMQCFAMQKTPTAHSGFSAQSGRRSPSSLSLMNVFGPEPKPASGRPGAISFSKISSGDFVLDEILHQAHRVQQIYADCYKPASHEFCMLFLFPPTSFLLGIIFNSMIICYTIFT